MCWQKKFGQVGILSQWQLEGVLLSLPPLFIDPLIDVPALLALILTAVHYWLQPPCKQTVQTLVSVHPLVGLPLCSWTSYHLT